MIERISAPPISSEQQLRFLVDAACDYAIYMLDPGGYVSSWNAGAERIKGYRIEEIIGRHFSIFFTEEDRQAEMPEQALRAAKQTGRFEHEGWRVRKDGSRFWANVVVRPIRDEYGSIIGFAKVTRDITERQESERQLAEAREQLFRAQQMEAERHFRATFEQAAVGLAHISRDGRWFRVNDKACEIAGYPREEFLRLGLQDITHPDDFQAQLAQIRAILDGTIESYSLEKRYIRKDGSLIWVNVTASAVRDAHGELDYFVHVVEDISARKAAETALQELNHTLERRVEARTREIERMAEANRRAAITRERLRIARDLHDTLANSIVGLLLQIRTARKQLTRVDPTTLESELAQTEQSAREALAQARAAVGELRYQVTGQEGLGPALERLVARLRARTSLEITLHVDPVAAGLEGERAEVVYRIAEEALRNVERHSTAEHVDVSLRVDRLNEAERLTLTVADDGAGFDPEATPSGHYGLIGMREQAELIGAELRVGSAPGQGTRVSVSVPV